jgi:hypothetical protein
VRDAGAGSLALGLAGFPFLFATLRALAYLLIAAALGLGISDASWAGVVVVLLAAAHPRQHSRHRGHSLTIDSGWKEVADAILLWLKAQKLP